MRDSTLTGKKSSEKSAALVKAEEAWYAAEQALQEAARAAAAEFLTDGERGGERRGAAGRRLQHAANDFTAAHEIVRTELNKAGGW